MIKGYSLPSQLDSEINQLEELIARHKKGEVSATELKAHRVPFGVYEQREPDTYMVRVRCAGGFVRPSHLESVSAIASQYGIRDLHLTSRQELQIHYVKLDDIIAVIRKLKEIGLATRGGGGNTVRNIAAAEDAGIDPNEEFDVSPYVLALTTRFIAESDSWSLPRKFKIAFSGSAEDKGYATISDVGFLARKKDGKQGFKVYVAGGLGSKSEVGKLLLDFVDADEVYPVAKALKNVFYKYGNRKNKHAARLRFLWQNLGEEEFKRRFQEEYVKVKDEKFLALALDEQDDKPPAVDLAEQKPLDHKDFILVQESIKHFPIPLRKSHNGFAEGDFLVWKSRFVKPQKQAGLFSILISIELGLVSCERALKLAQFLKPFGDNVLRITKDQNFLLRNIPEKYLGNVYNFLSEALAGFNRPAIYGRILSCAGASTCQLGICLSRQAARALMRALEASGLDLDRIGDIKINISGCPNSCGQHPAADLGFFGKALRKDGRLYPAYNILAGAVIRDGQTKLAQQVAEVPARDLPVLVKDLLGLYLSKAKTYAGFREYIARDGKEDLKQLCSRYKEIPGFEQDKNHYFDWDADTVFSLAERRTGECSAGLFDLIEVDLNNIKETRKALGVAQEDKAQKALRLSELVFYASRMLLITRGVEPKSEQEALDAFLRYFVEEGLISQSFKSLISIVRQKDYEDLLKAEGEVYEFTKAVESLYENMDNSFNFKKPAATSDTKKEAEPPVVVKDFRGVACPLNFVKTKVELSKLNLGDILEVWLDDGEPIENVPGSVKAEGHKIISQNKIGDYWSLVIEKK